MGTHCTSTCNVHKDEIEREKEREREREKEREREGGRELS